MKSRIGFSSTEEATSVMSSLLDEVMCRAARIGIPPLVIAVAFQRAAAQLARKDGVSDEAIYEVLRLALAEDLGGAAKNWTH